MSGVFRRPARPPAQILRTALLWCGLTLVGAFGLSVLTAMIAGIEDALWVTLTHPEPASAANHVNREMVGIAGAIGVQVALLQGAIRWARKDGGDWQAGLALYPVRRWRSMVVPALGVLLWVLAEILLLAWLAQAQPWLLPRLPRLLSQSFSPLARVLQVLLIVVLAPAGEELFFRGWLWTALRRHWGLNRTLWCTTLLWAGLHLLDGVSLRPMLLIPTGLLLGLARERTDSVAGSLGLHVMNNLVAVAIPLLASGSIV